MEFVVEKVPSYKQFIQNMELKLQTPEFLGDMDILIREGADRFNPIAAYELVKKNLINFMPGSKD